jgi:signal transduction histidine kinase
LTAIKGYVRGLQDGVATTPEKTERYLATILAKTTEMEVLVERLFLYSNLDAGSEVMYFSEVDIAEFLIGFLDVVRHDMAQKGLSITYAPAPGGNVRVSIDCDQMGRVLNNILGNSAKYKTKETGNITIRTYLDGDRLFLEIADDGEGVPEETLPKIFNILYRVDSARANPHKGNGIGLAIAKRIVAAHCGTIEAKNEDGLTITIMLPVKDLVNESVGEFADGPAQAPPKGEPA